MDKASTIGLDVANAARHMWNGPAGKRFFR